jgi:hypothetical protein
MQTKLLRFIKSAAYGSKTILRKGQNNGNFWFILRMKNEMHRGWVYSGHTIKEAAALHSHSKIT